MAQLQRGRLLETDQRFRRLPQERPRHAAALQFLRAALLQQEDLPDGLSGRRQSLALLPMRPSWWENLGAAEERAGHSEATALARHTASRLRGHLQRGTRPERPANP